MKTMRGDAMDDHAIVSCSLRSFFPPRKGVASAGRIALYPSPFLKEMIE